MSSFNVKDARERVAFNPAHLDDYGLDVYEFRVYMRLVRRAGGLEGQARESVPNMAIAMQFSENKVRYALKVLQAVRMIQLEADVSGMSKSYVLLSSTKWAPATQYANLKAVALETDPEKCPAHRRLSVQKPPTPSHAEAPSPSEAPSPYAFTPSPYAFTPSPGEAKGSLEGSTKKVLGQKRGDKKNIEEPKPAPLEPEPASTYVYAEESGIFGNKPHGKQTASDENFFRGLMGDGFVRKISDPAALRRWRAEHGDDYIRLAAQVAKDPDLQPPGKKPIWLFEDYLVQCVTLPTPLMQFKRQDKAKDLERLQFERERPDLQDGDRVQWNRDMQFYTLYGGIVTGGFTLEERPDVGIVPAEQLLLVERPDYDWSEGAYLPTHTEIKQQQYAENALRDAA